MHTHTSSWTVLGAAVVIGGALLACKGKKTEPTPTTTPETPATTEPAPTAAAEVPTKTFNVGETAKAIDYALTVSSVKQCKPKYYFSKPKKGTQWLGVELVVEAITDKQVWSNASHAKLIDGDGLTYNYSFASTKDCDPSLAATQLSKSEKAKGWVVFEVPEKVSGLKLTYNSSIIGTPQQVKFDLGKLPGEASETAAADTAAAKTAEPAKTTPVAKTTPAKTTPAKTTPATKPTETAKTAPPPTATATAKPPEPAKTAPPPAK